jgi:hypothetical protein
MIASWTVCPGFLRHHDHIRSHGQLLATWPGFDPSDSPTLCFREADGVWILRADRGGIRFTQHEHDLRAYPSEGADAEQFKRMVFHEWLPFVYNFWGLQVLHASAAVHSPSGQVVAFSGASGAGKSTFGYGLGRLPHWRQIADDSLAFAAQPDSLRLLPIPNEVLLRPASARYYGDGDLGDEFLGWAEGSLRLRRIFFLEPSDDLEAPLRLLRVSRARACVLLLPQAYTLALDTHKKNAPLIERPKDNPQQVAEYLTLASQVGVLRLLYPRKFGVLSDVFSLIEDSLFSNPLAGSK